MSETENKKKRKALRASTPCCKATRTEFDVDAVFTKYVSEKRFCLTRDDLRKELDKHEDPFSSSWGTQNLALLVFPSHVWDLILKEQFCAKTDPSIVIQSTTKTFIKEIKTPTESESGFDINLFKMCAMRLKDTGFRYAMTDNFYEVPAILRVLAVSYKTLCSNDHKIPKHRYLGDALKGLPHRVLWKPYLGFSFDSNVPELVPNTGENVSTKVI